MAAALFAELGDAAMIALLRERANGLLSKGAKVLAVEMLVCHSCRS
jgi:hypothetical protein